MHISISQLEFEKSLALVFGVCLLNPMTKIQIELTTYLHTNIEKLRIVGLGIQCPLNICVTKIKLSQLQIYILTLKF